MNPYLENLSIETLRIHIDKQMATLMETINSLYNQHNNEPQPTQQSTPSTQPTHHVDSSPTLANPTSMEILPPHIRKELISIITNSTIITEHINEQIESYITANINDHITEHLNENLDSMIETFINNHVSISIIN